MFKPTNGLYITSFHLKALIAFDVRDMLVPAECCQQLSRGVCCVHVSDEGWNVSILTSLRET
jgi:hypothetical protein